MEQLVDVTRAGRRQSIRLMRDRRGLTKAEEAALAAFMARAHPPTATGGSGRSAKAASHIDPVGSKTLTGPEQSVTDTLLTRLIELDPDGEITTRLAEGLGVLAPVRFRLTDSEPPLAVLRSFPGSNPVTLLDVLADEDLATALDLAVGGLPAGYWAIPALVARTVHVGRSRRVGRELEDLLDAPVA
jgi:hypothetical protein